MISDKARNWSIFEASTDPPYKTGGVFLFLKISISVFFIKRMVFKSSVDCGILPVPIDHIGSYATIMWFLLNFFSKAELICFFKTLNVCLFAF